MRESNESCPIARAQAADKSVGRGLQFVQGCPDDTVANVQNQGDAHGLSLPTDELDLLADAVVEELEVVFGKPEKRLPFPADEDVHANRLHVDAVGRPFLCLHQEQWKSDKRAVVQRATSSRRRLRSGTKRPHRPRSYTHQPSNWAKGERMATALATVAFASLRIPAIVNAESRAS